MMKRILTFILLFASLINVKAQRFEQYFTDATLRLDYIFSGNATKQSIAIDEQSRIPRWYGKHQRLSELPMEGNGQITVRTHRSHEVI